MASFKELLKLSFKSEDTEEWLDVHLLSLSYLYSWG